MDEKLKKDSATEEEDFPEEVVFKFGDLVNLYEGQAKYDETIKDFVEKIKEYFELAIH